MLAEVDEHLGANRGVFHNLARAAAVDGTWRRGPWALQRRFDHETRNGGEELSLRHTLIRKSVEKQRARGVLSERARDRLSLCCLRQGRRKFENVYCYSWRKRVAEAGLGCTVLSEARIHLFPRIQLDVTCFKEVLCNRRSYCVTLFRGAICHGYWREGTNKPRRSRMVGREGVVENAQ